MCGKSRKPLAATSKHITRPILTPFLSFAGYSYPRETARSQMCRCQCCLAPSALQPRLLLSTCPSLPAATHLKPRAARRVAVSAIQYHAPCNPVFLCMPRPSLPAATHLQRAPSDASLSALLSTTKPRLPLHASPPVPPHPRSHPPSTARPQTHREDCGAPCQLTSRGKVRQH